MDDFYIKYHLFNNFLICVKNMKNPCKKEKDERSRKPIKVETLRFDHKKFHKLTMGVDIFAKKEWLLN